jgi:mevalonate kinase
LGSSGALVAAFFQKYVSNPGINKTELSPREIRTLKEQLAQLESWFHGTSSGIDPLICYMKHPLLLRDLDHIEPIGLPQYNEQHSEAIFLINSGKPGRTAPLVQNFMNRYHHDKVFYNFVKNTLTPLNNACINNLIENQKEKFYNSLKELSAIQEEFLQQIVPSTVRQIWDDGLNSDEYYLKLCGSGGGGFVLGFTQNYIKTRKILENKGMEVIPVYQDLRKMTKQ